MANNAIVVETIWQVEGVRNINSSLLHRLQIISVLGLSLLLLYGAWLGEQNNHATPALTVTQQQFFIDEQKEHMGVDDVIQMTELAFSSLPDLTHFGLTTKPVWLRMHIHNPHSKAMQWVFNSEHYQIHTAKAYWVDKKKPQLIYDKNGSNASKLVYNDTNMAFSVQLAAGQSKTLLINYHSYFYSHVHIKFQNFGHYLDSHYFRQGATIAMIAMLGLICFVNLSMYVALRESYHLLYLTQQGLAIVLLLSYFGYFNADGRVVLLLCQLTVANGLLFTARFLELKQRFSRAYSLFFYLALLLILWLPVTYWDISHENIFSFTMPLLAATVMVLPIFFAIRLYFRGLDYVMPFIVGGLALTLYLSFFLIGVFDIVIVEFVPHYVFLYLALLLEALLVFVSISMKMEQARQKQQNYYQTLQEVYRRQAQEASELHQQAQQVDQALAQKQQKSTQLATTSHDIHHHLYSMKLNLASMAAASQETKNIDGLKQSVDYLQGVTEDILQSARHNHVTTHHQINLCTFFASLEQSLATKAKQKSIDLRWHCLTERFLSGSHVLLKRIMENLINNAIEYTHKGGVLFAVRERKQHWLLCIYDTGNGISDHHLKQLFSVFKKSDSMLNEGYGLGLYIAATLCHQANYQLEVKSRKGKGTVFFIQIAKTE